MVRLCLGLQGKSNIVTTVILILGGGGGHQGFGFVSTCKFVDTKRRQHALHMFTLFLLLS